MRTLYAAGPWPDLSAIALDDEEARHGRTVLRLREGDSLRLIDGLGHWAEARIVRCDKKALICQAEKVQLQAPIPGRHLTLWVCAPKGSRFEDMVRSLCELGVGRIQPLNSERSIRSPNLSRAKRVAIDASKQSGRAYVTEMGPVVDFPTAEQVPQHAMLLDPLGEVPAAGAGGEPMPTTLIIGPEGGLTDAEREHLTTAGARAIRLAPTVLRIETAAIAAAAWWTASWEQHGSTNA